MQLHSVQGNSQRLDGGAMFGNCPRAVWEKWAAPDAHNRIALACRALLVREGERNVMLEAGIGAFFEPKLRDRYGVQEEEHVLLASLAELGLRAADIDVIVLSHLHFDHAGGLLEAWQPDQPLRLAFPNARFVVGQAAWERACQPHPRDRASFIPGLTELLEKSGRVEVVEAGATQSQLLGDRYQFSYSDGHTPGLTLTRVDTPRGTVTFAADLIPASPWIHTAITMGYDRYPELLIDEKRELLERVAAEGSWLFFTHDHEIAACRIEKSDDGRFAPVDSVRSLSWS